MKEIISSITLTNEVHIFFEETHFKGTIRDLNKNSSPGPDKVTPELLQNGKTSYYIYFHFITRLLSLMVFSQMLKTRQQNLHEKTRQR